MECINDLIRAGHPAGDIHPSIKYVEDDEVIRKNGKLPIIDKKKNEK
jgi:hypothetical protein